MPNRLYLVSGMTDGRPYIGLAQGVNTVTEYRIYADRSGWFVGGEYYGLNAPRGSHSITEGVQRVGIEAFRDVLLRGEPKWRLQEELGIR